MISVESPELPGVVFADLWPRSFSQGDAEGYVGTDLMVTISRPFSKDEDALFKWLMRQDGCLLIGIKNLSDGRDLILFERRFTKQSEAEAVDEHRRHLSGLIERLELRRLEFVSTGT